MLRRIALVSLAVVLALAIVSVASAKDNIADTFKKGSLLVFPKIVAIPTGLDTAGAGLVDTYVFIGNDNSLPVSVKCYWMDSNQTIEDFQFPITANQPVYFRASTGAGADPLKPNTLTVPPFAGVGSLVCFAVDDGGQNAVKFNHLYGSALIVNGVTTNPGRHAVLYNAYSFAAPGNPAAVTAGQLPLDSVIYDACPQYLVSNFLAAETGTITPTVLDGFQRPDLTLWPCKQDLRQDRLPTCTKAKFDVWNENEVKFTGAYQCFKCFLEVFLDDIGRKAAVSGLQGAGDPSQKGNGFGYDKFIESALGTELARFRVQGIASSVCKFRAPWDVCNGKTQNTPLLGLLLYGSEAAPFGMNTVINQKVIDAIAGHTPFGAGKDASGLVQWDPSGSTPEVPAQ